MERLNEQQNEIFMKILGGNNLFLTGAGGTGKSHLIKFIKEYYTRIGIKVAVTALTGIAGLNIGGETIHRWAGIGTGDKSGDELLQMARKKSKNWNGTAILIVDEVSMLSPSLFEKLDFVGRNIRRVNKPFGGIQLIFSGDFCQLPPVESDQYCFECDTWKRCNFLQCELTQIMRQNDLDFQTLLTEVRMGIVSQKTKDILNARLGAKLENKDGIIPTKLFPIKRAVDKINQEELAKISRENNKPYRYNAQNSIINPKNIKVRKEIEENWLGSLDKSCQAKSSIVLLKTANVMLIANIDPDAGLVNGSRGVVESFENNLPVVRFLNGIERVVKSHEWTMKINDNIEVSRKQIPLVLGYAATIHKSQSLTIDYVEADLGSDNFADGQFYTALSRVRSLEGLTISALDFSRCSCHPKVIEYYKTLTHFELDEDDRPKIVIDQESVE